MIDPINVTDYNRTENELQEFIAFGLLVTGKNAITTSRLLDNFIKDFKYEDDALFEVFKRFELTVLSQALKNYGFGCYNAKAKGIYQLVRANLNLRTCTVDDLEKISGIGKKTSRFFVLHTRQDAQCIPLDVHILHYLRDLGHDVPKATPCNKKYLEIEKICLKYVSSSKKTCAEWDLDTWRTYSGNKVAI